MKEIYARADRVLIWLGPDCDSIPDAVALGEAICSLIHHEGPRVDEEELQAKGIPISLDHPQWVAYFKVLGSPWWRRAWCVQEFVLGRNCFFVGADGLEEGWSTFAISLALSLRLSLVPARHLTILPAINMLQLRTRHLAKDLKERPLPFMHLLASFMGAQATRRIDILYALRGLASDADDPVLNPDYSKPYSAVCQTYMIYFLQRDLTNKVVRLSCG